MELAEGKAEVRAENATLAASDGCEQGYRIVATERELGWNRLVIQAGLALCCGAKRQKRLASEAGVARQGEQRPSRSDGAARLGVNIEG